MGVETSIVPILVPMMMTYSDQARRTANGPSAMANPPSTEPMTTRKPDESDHDVPLSAKLGGVLSR